MQTGAPQKAGERLGDDLFGATKKEMEAGHSQKTVVTGQP